MVFKKINSKHNITMLKSYADLTSQYNLTQQQFNLTTPATILLLKSGVQIQ